MSGSIEIVEGYFLQIREVSNFLVAEASEGSPELEVVEHILDILENRLLADTPTG